MYAVCCDSNLFSNYRIVINLGRLGRGRSELGFFQDGGTATLLLPPKYVCTKPRKLSAIHQEGHPFTVSYLVDSCGLSPKIAISVSKRVHFTTPEKPDLVLALFRERGFGTTHISKIISKTPRLIVYSPKRTLIPKLDFFRSLGLSDSEIATFFSRNPYVLQHSLKNRIIPCFEFLKSVLGTYKVATAAVMKGRKILLTDFRQNLFRNLQLLRQEGVPGSVISFALVNHSGVLTQSSDRLSAGVKEVIKLGIRPSLIAFVRALEVVTQMSRSKWDRKVQIFKRWGCSDNEIITAFRNYPECMLISEKKIMYGMDFLVKEIGLKPSDVTRYPIVLAFSLENRIIPRCSVVRVLQLKGLLKKDSSFNTFIRLSEKQFMEKVVNKYREMVPQLLSVYQRKVGLRELGFGPEDIGGNGRAQE